MDERVPEAVRSDPEAYDAFVRQQMEGELARRRQSEGQLGKQASELLTKIKDGSTSFFDRMSKQLAGRRNSGGRVGEFSSPLLLPGDDSRLAPVSSTRASSSAYAPPADVISPLTAVSRPTGPL